MNLTSLFSHQAPRDLTLELTGHLIEAPSLNEYMELVLPKIGRLFGTEKLCLVDYYEHTDHFDLIHFEGYPPDFRFNLQRRMREMEVQRAGSERQPYRSHANPNLLCIPFYLQDILEAVLVVEGDQPIELTPERSAAALIISTFLGLFMSSTRLEVNREQLVDFNDLHRAREIQLNFLPRGYPNRPKYEVFGYSTSSNLVGGDYFDYFDDRGDSVQCILADACGHGLAAALIMSNFRGILKSQVSRHDDYSQLFNSLNQLMHFDEDLIQYLTGVFLYFDQESGVLRYLNAGHYEPLVFDLQGNVRGLPGSGPPLGMFKGSKYVPGEVRLQQGDLVVLYTDGLVDVETRDGDYFGTEGITAAIQDHRSLPLEQISEQVVRSAEKFGGAGSFEDDATLFLMRIK